VVRQARKRLAASELYLHFLPPYSPELNEIEPMFRQVKYEEIAVRSHTTRAGFVKPSKVGSTPTAGASGREV
jgi:transposase